jgi:hypothetical protein
MCPRSWSGWPTACNGSTRPCRTRSPGCSRCAGAISFAGFFEALFAGVVITRFEVNKIFGGEFFDDDSTVVDLVRLEYTARASGRKVPEIDELHIWHFDAAGKVKRVRQRADTLLQAWSIDQA